MKFRLFIESSYMQATLSAALPFIEGFLSDPQDESNVRVLSDWLQDTSDPTLNEMGVLLDRLLSGDPWRDQERDDSVFPFTREIRRRVADEFDHTIQRNIIEWRDYSLQGIPGGVVAWEELPETYYLFADTDGLQVVKNPDREEILIEDFIKSHPHFETPILRWLVMLVLSFEERQIQSYSAKSSRSLRIVLLRLAALIYSIYELRSGLDTGQGTVQTFAEEIDHLFAQAKKLGAKEELMPLRTTLRRQIQSVFPYIEDRDDLDILQRLWNDYSI